MRWTFVDAVEIACQMYRNGEIKFDDLDRVTMELWQGMQEENAGQ